MTSHPLAVRIIGAGRAGGSFADALSAVGHDVALVHHDDAGEPVDTDLVLLCVPDAAVADVAARIPHSDTAVIAHCAGSLGLVALDGHRRVASIHPLVSLPDRSVGAQRLRGAWFAVAGDPLVNDLAVSLGGTAVTVADADRVRYHAAAAVASNHLVALMGQVERLAASAGVPLEAFLSLAAGSLDNVATLGPAAALTGPVARGDWVTVQAHLDALPDDERGIYLALVAAADRLAGGDGSALGHLT